MSFKLSKRSLDRLAGVDEALVRVVKRAIEITSVDFAVSEGLRNKERQKELFDKGLSQTMNSKHLIGKAVDLAAWVNNTVSWEQSYYFEIAKAMKQAAKELDVNIRWGGDFKSFFDGPHFELI